uniref:Hypothetical chloroplast RF1 n=1 Tax=Floydiella terrestris TaxID=51328 RepID=E2DSI8_FLOTE|nr:hypothetical chloroplast RF1 [Floydiella terrestris]ACZ58462.1 hypothetical chloroplast RF1 [Floydiella terrestris]
MTLVTALKDYVEVVHKLIETAPAYINNHSDYTDLVTLFASFFSNLKQGTLDFLSFEWISNIFYLPIVVPQMASAMFSEVSVFDGKFQNFATFLDQPGSLLKENDSFSLPLSLFGKFLIGFTNSLFLWIPTSAATFLCLRRFAMQGIEAGYAAALGTMAANFLWLASVVLGLRFVLVPWMSLDLARYCLGFLLLIKYFWDNRLPSKEVKHSFVFSQSALQKIFCFHFLLALTEQSSLFPFLSNFTPSTQSNAMEGFSATNSFEFFSIHIFYLLGLLIGSFSCILFICWFCEEPAYSAYVWVNKNLRQIRMGSLVRTIHFFFQTTTFIFACSSLPYLGIEYAITNPLGFVPNDSFFHQFKETAFLTHSTSPAFYRSRTNFVNQKVFRNSDWAEFHQKTTPLDTSLYDQGAYRFYTMEDLHYGADYEWLRRRSEKVKIRGRMKRLRWFPRSWANRLWDLAKTWSRRNIAWRTEILSQYTRSWDSNAAPSWGKLVREDILPSLQSRPWGADPAWGQKFVDSGSSKTEKNGFWWDWWSRRSFADNDTWWNWLSSKNSSFLANQRKNDLLLFNETGDLSSTIKEEQSFGGDLKKNVPSSNSSFFEFQKSLGLNSPKKASSFWMPRERMLSLYSEQTFLKKKHQFTQEFSTLRKFVRKLESRRKTLSNPFLKKNESSVLDLSSFSNLERKRGTEFQALSISDVLSQKTNEKADSSLFSKNTTEIENSPLSKYKDVINTSTREEKSTSSLFSKNNESISNLKFEKNIERTNAGKVLFHPVKFYLHKQEGFLRKLSFYGVKASREFKPGNNSPAMVFYLRTYFQNMKPTRISFKRTKMIRDPGIGAQNRVKQMAYSDPKAKRDRILSGTPWIRQWVSREGFLARRKRLEAWIKHQHYDPDELWSVLMKADVDTFMKRQPFSHFLTPNEERLLHLRRFLLFEHYDSLRWYTYMQHYRAMKTRLGGTKSFTSRLYNQQFKGTFHKVRHLFSLTPSVSGGSVFKFDQPLYNEWKKEDSFKVQTSLLHEEFLNQEKTRGDSFSLSNPSSPLQTTEKKQPSYLEKLNPEKENFSSAGQKDLIEQSLNGVREYFVRATPIRQEILRKLISEKNYEELTLFLRVGQKQLSNSSRVGQNSLSNIEKENFISKNKNELMESFSFGKNQTLSFSPISSFRKSQFNTLFIKQRRKGAKDYRRASERLWKKWKKRFSWEQENRTLPKRFGKKSFALLEKEEEKKSSSNFSLLTVKNFLEKNMKARTVLDKEKIEKEVLLAKIQNLESQKSLKNLERNPSLTLFSNQKESTLQPFQKKETHFFFSNAEQSLMNQSMSSIQKALKDAVKSYKKSKNSNSSVFSGMNESAFDQKSSDSFSLQTSFLKAELQKRFLISKKEFLNAEQHAIKTKIRKLLEKNSLKLFSRKKLSFLTKPFFFKKRNNVLFNRKFLVEKSGNALNSSDGLFSKIRKYEKLPLLNEKKLNSFSSQIQKEDWHLSNLFTNRKKTLLRNRANFRKNFLNVQNLELVLKNNLFVRALRHQGRRIPGTRPRLLYTKKREAKRDTFFIKDGFKNFDETLESKTANLADFSIPEKKSVKSSFFLKPFLRLANTYTSTPPLFTKAEEIVHSFSLSLNRNLEKKQNLFSIKKRLKSKFTTLPGVSFSEKSGNGKIFRNFLSPAGIVSLNQRLDRAKQRRKNNPNSIPVQISDQMKPKTEERKNIFSFSSSAPYFFFDKNLSKVEIQSNQFLSSAELAEEISPSNTQTTISLAELAEEISPSNTQTTISSAEEIAPLNTQTTISSAEEISPSNTQTTISSVKELVERISLFDESATSVPDSLYSRSENDESAKEVSTLVQKDDSDDSIDKLSSYSNTMDVPEYQKRSLDSLTRTGQQEQQFFKEENKSFEAVNKVLEMAFNKENSINDLIEIAEKLSSPNTELEEENFLKEEEKRFFSRKNSSEFFERLVYLKKEKEKKSFYSVNDLIEIAEKEAPFFSRLKRKEKRFLTKRRALGKNSFFLNKKKKEIRKKENLLFAYGKKDDVPPFIQSLDSMVGMTTWLRERKKGLLTIQQQKRKNTFKTFESLTPSENSSFDFKNENSFFSSFKNSNREQLINVEKRIIEEILLPTKSLRQQAHAKRFNARKLVRPKRLSRLSSLADHFIKGRSKKMKAFYESFENLKNFRNFAFRDEKKKFHDEILQKWLGEKRRFVLTGGLFSEGAPFLIRKEVPFSNSKTNENHVLSLSLKEREEKMKNENFLQIGDRESKPLAAPVSLRIREKSFSNKKESNSETPVSLSFQNDNTNSFFFSGDPLLNKDSEKGLLINKVYSNVFIPSENENSFSDKIENSKTKSDSFLEGKNQLLTTNPIPFYAGWDESLRKFVITNRLLSRKEAGYAVSLLSLRKEAPAVETTPFNFQNWPLQGRNAATTLFSHLPFMTPPLLDKNNSEIIKYELSTRIMEKEKPSTALRDSKNQTSEQIRKEELVSTENNKTLFSERIKKSQKRGSSSNFRKVTNMVLLDQIKKRRSALFLPLRWRSSKKTTARVLVKAKSDLSEVKLHSSSLKKNQSLFTGSFSERNKRKRENLDKKILPKLDLLRSLRKGNRARRRLPRLRNLKKEASNNGWKWTKFFSRRIRKKMVFLKHEKRKKSLFVSKSKLGKKLGWQKLRWSFSGKKRSEYKKAKGERNIRRKTKRDIRQKIYLRQRKRPLRRRSLGVLFTEKNLHLKKEIEREGFTNRFSYEESNSFEKTPAADSGRISTAPIQTRKRWSVKRHPRKIYRHLFTPLSLNLPVLYDVLPGHSRFLPSIKTRPAPGSSVSTVRRAKKWTTSSKTSSLRRGALMHGWAMQQLLQNMVQKNDSFSLLSDERFSEKKKGELVLPDGLNSETRIENFQSQSESQINSFLLKKKEFLDKKLLVSDKTFSRQRQLHRGTYKLRELSYTLPLRLYDRWFFYYYIGGREDPLQNVFKNVSKQLEKNLFSSFLKKPNKETEQKLENQKTNEKESTFSSSKKSGARFFIKKRSLQNARRFLTFKPEQRVSFTAYLKALERKAAARLEKKKEVRLTSRQMEDLKQNVPLSLEKEISSSNLNEKRIDDQISQNSSSEEKENMWWYNFHLFKKTSSLKEDEFEKKDKKARFMNADNNLQDMLSFVQYDHAPFNSDFRSPRALNRHYPLNGGFVWPGDYLRLQTIYLPKERKTRQISFQKENFSVKKKEMNQNSTMSSVPYKSYTEQMLLNTVSISKKDSLLERNEKISSALIKERNSDELRSENFLKKKKRIRKTLSQKSYASSTQKGKIREKVNALRAILEPLK